MIVDDEKMFFALLTDDRGLARTIDPGLFACRSAAEVATYFLTAGVEPNAYDELAAAAVLASSGDEEGVYALLSSAHDRAAAEKQFHLAVAARERLAAHALLFGDLARAHRAIEEAIETAQSHRLRRWLLCCAAAASRLALETGDLVAAARWLDRGRTVADCAQDLARLAGVGAQLAMEREDHEAIAEWTSPEIAACAQHSQASDVVIGATIATVISDASPPGDATRERTLRRALVLTESAAKAPELFSIAARYGELQDARFSVDALAAVFAPNRPYLRAHRLIARAYFLARSGERAESVDAAGDAARAFSAMGSRRWTNEAMRLLVSHESAERRPRSRHAGSALTEREEQVAHLIRRGARNREVAVALQISEHTVERHVSSILGRLGLRSRWQIADPGRFGQR